MNTYIAFLRGINVGGQKKILMSDLILLFRSFGFSDVRTYIQSGNVLFCADSNKDLPNRIRKGIMDEYGWDVSVFVRTPNEIATILATCPFSEEKRVNSYFILLSAAPDKSLVAELSKVQIPDEEFFITPDCVYFYSEIGYGRSRFNNNFFERKLMVQGTARNYRTLNKLVELAK